MSADPGEVDRAQRLLLRLLAQVEGEVAADLLPRTEGQEDALAIAQEVDRIVRRVVEGEAGIPGIERELWVTAICLLLARHFSKLTEEG